MKIYAGRFENDDDDARLLEQFKRPASIGVKWSLENFGVQRIEANVACRNKQEAYQRYRYHHGQRLALYSPRLSRPISGNITSIVILANNVVQYVAKGPVNRMADEPDTTTYTASQTVYDAIVNLLGSFVVIDDGTIDHIAANSTPLAGWQPALPAGGFATDGIKALLQKSDSASNVYDFWMVDQPMDRLSLRKFTPHYKAREENAKATWVVKLKDLRGSPDLTRSIDEFATKLRVYYGLVTGTATGGSDTTMSDTTKNFIVAGVTPGVVLTNITNSGQGRIISLTATVLTFEGAPLYRGEATGGSTTTISDTTTLFTGIVAVGDVLINESKDIKGTVTTVGATTLTMSGGMTGGATNTAGDRYRVVSAFGAGDAYSIRTTAQTKFEEANTDTVPYWNRTKNIFEASMNGIQASQYAEAAVDTEPTQTQSVTIGAKYVKDSNGASWHPLEMIARGGGYLQISDLFPEIVLSITSMNKLTTFKLTAMSYNEINHTMACSLDVPDLRLDARLRRANILNSEMIIRD